MAMDTRSMADIADRISAISGEISGCGDGVKGTTVS
jgi:hypothetical protein